MMANGHVCGGRARWLAAGALACAVLWPAGLTGAPGPPGRLTRDEAASRAGAAMDALQQALQARLTSAMAQGGPAVAVLACQFEARTITERVARAHALELGRTSVRVRSGANAPRPWAAKIVEKAGQKKAAAVTLQVVDLGDRFGVLRPIGTVDLCTKCHGEPGVVRQNLGDALALAYPKDQAVGFATGDLRGWMWAEVPKSGRLRGTR